ncbi:EAL domain-containing protein [Coleofasciculus sp.]|uniref:EAL domain-containing protein n=1 Tax=Coleofasciculus sp. TaxID=3100458 RepID=UPI003A2EE757
MSEQLRLLQSLIPAIAKVPDLHSALDLVLHRVCEVTHWDYGEAWLPTPDSRSLTCSQAWFGDPCDLQPWRRTRETLTFPPNIGLPGRVWRSKKPEWIDQTKADNRITPDTEFTRLSAMDQPQEFQAGGAIPILLDDQILAVLTFFTRHSHPSDRQWMEWVAAIAMQLGLVMERQQLTEQLHQQQEFNQNLVETHGGFFVAIDPQGKTRMMNPRLLETLGYTLDEVRGTDFVTTFLRDVDRKPFAKLIKTTDEKSELQSPTVHQTGVLTKEGQELWVEWRSQQVFKKSGELDFFFAIGRDQNEHCLTHQETARLASFPLLTPNPIVEIDLAGRVRYLNPEAMRLLPELLDSEAEHPFLAEIPSMIRLMQQQGSFRREVKIGEIVYEQVLHYVPEIECIRIYALDITDRKRAEELLLFNAFYDRLTGLANRALFMDRLQQAGRRAQPSQGDNRDSPSHRFAVVLLNLNRFKVVNESLGNHLGDQVLQEFGQRLQNCLRPTDTVARLGGDEFAILLEGIQGVCDAIQVADAIEQTLTLPFNLEGRDVFMTTSIGIALNTNRDRRILSAEDILRNANTAMHRARSQGKPGYAIFDNQMLSRTVDRLQLETDMRRAIERQEFQVHYQPIVSLLTHQITGFEALVRWQHPQRGLVFPAEFIPIAEETGLIIPMGWWILREACHQLSIWQQQFQSPQPLTMNVNLSCKQFRQPDLLAQIDQILAETNIAVGSLKLEITESVVIDNPELVKDLLLELKKRQINLCIDDFGTGYSSLSRLHNFPISTLKIDRSFISRIGALGENSEIVQAIITLARTMSMDVVAEGIELLEQVSPLVALQCHYGQGFLFSKPVDSDGARELLRGKSVQLERQFSRSVMVKNEVKTSVSIEDDLGQ